MKTFTKLTSALLLTFGLANASEYKLDNSHTAVGFSVKHLMITNVKGDFKNYDAKIDFDKASEIVLRELRAGKLGAFCLEIPNK